MDSDEHIERRPPVEWMEREPYRQWEILDPDGWDRTNLAVDWERPLTEREFSDKLMFCTLIGRPPAT